MTSSRPTATPRRRRNPSVLAALGVALAAGGCQNTNILESIGSRNVADAASAASADTAAKSQVEWRREAEALGPRYRADPQDPQIALAYARALRASGQRTQAVSVLEQASLADPHNSALLGAYGRALAEVGHLDQALEVLGRAHTPERPDWRILSAQGAVLDQLGRHTEAQRYYASALKIRPDDPAVLSNLGLSYALAKDLKNAEATLRRAAAFPGADPRVRQNLALVVGLQGRFTEAEGIARADLPSDEATANAAYLRQLLEQQGELKAHSAGSARRT